MALSKQCAIGMRVPDDHNDNAYQLDCLSYSSSRGTVFCDGKTPSHAAISPLEMATMNAPIASGVDLPLWGNTCPLCKFCTANPVGDSMPMLSGMLG